MPYEMASFLDRSRAKLRRDPSAPMLRLVVAIHEDGSGGLFIYADRGDQVCERARVSLIREDWIRLREFLEHQVAAQ